MAVLKEAAEQLSHHDRLPAGDQAKASSSCVPAQSAAESVPGKSS